RRHTRSTRDWSSDVCSSDLASTSPRSASAPLRFSHGFPDVIGLSETRELALQPKKRAAHTGIALNQETDMTRIRQLLGKTVLARSEERRVGKEGRVGRRQES